jgi:hypothetical protein
VVLIILAEVVPPATLTLAIAHSSTHACLCGGRIVCVFIKLERFCPLVKLLSCTDEGLFSL